MNSPKIVGNRNIVLSMLFVFIVAAAAGVVWIIKCSPEYYSRKAGQYVEGQVRAATALPATERFSTLTNLLSTCIDFETAWQIDQEDCVSKEVDDRVAKEWLRAWNELYNQDEAKAYTLLYKKQEKEHSRPDFYVYSDDDKWLKINSLRHSYLAKMLSLAEESAQHHRDAALLMLAGNVYFDGSYLPANYEKAKRYWSVAWQLGERDVAGDLAAVYKACHDPVNAYLWILRKEEGNTAERQNTEKDLTPLQVSVAQRESNDNSVIELKVEDFHSLTKGNT